MYSSVIQGTPFNFLLTKMNSACLSLSDVNFDLKQSHMHWTLFLLEYESLQSSSRKSFLKFSSLKERNDLILLITGERRLHLTFKPVNQ